ncbi:MAG: glutamate--tRNA ligase family protein [Bacteroidota bacterium]|nr:glutamate--tRNA ligase family protein [Bacteroidota bacterium]
MFNKTRIAPTPSGYLHLGNVYSFALTAALAEQSGAKILLRIDDLDRDRVLPEYVDDIFGTLGFLDIPWDEGPMNSGEFGERYSQVHRLELYRRALEDLRASGSVFACVCSRSQLSRTVCTCKDKALPLDTPDAAWRLDTTTPRQLNVRIWSGVGVTGGNAPGSDATIMATLPADMQNFIVRRKDGFPAYQLTSMLDDLHYGVDLVVRGEDLRSSTMAQQYLSVVLQKDAFRRISFYHHPLLLGPGHKKLSKSAGTTSVQHLRKEGYDRQAICTMIARMLGLPQARPRTWQELIGQANSSRL